MSIKKKITSITQYRTVKNCYVNFCGRKSLEGGGNTMTVNHKFILKNSTEIKEVASVLSVIHSCA